MVMIMEDPIIYSYQAKGPDLTYWFDCGPIELHCSAIEPRKFPLFPKIKFKLNLYLWTYIMFMKEISFIYIFISTITIMNQLH